MNELVEIQNNQVVTSSRMVAHVFDKLHKHVIESIHGILSAENSAINFSAKRRTLTGDGRFRNIS